MITRDWPYFAPYSKEIQKCLNGASCTLEQSLGKYCQILYSLICVLGFEDGANEVSLHLPHLMTSSGSLTPGALIPFCSYQNNLTILGQERHDLPIRPCNKFKPTVLEGHLCYSLDMNTIQKKKSKVGVGAGLMIVLDQGNNNGNKKLPDTSQHFRDKFMILDLEASEDDDNSARIYLNTLSSFTDSRSGSYALSSFKKMTGTDGFLQQTEAQKK